MEMQTTSAEPRYNTLAVLQIPASGNLIMESWILALEHHFETCIVAYLLPHIEYGDANYIGRTAL